MTHSRAIDQPEIMMALNHYETDNIDRMRMNHSINGALLK